jgi:hypothetical protein
MEEQYLFPAIPQELFYELFCYLQVEDLGKVARVNKLFYQKVLEYEKIQRSFCLTWWKEKELKLDLEWAVKSSQKNWIWFARCFSENLPECGFSCEFPTVSVGDKKGYIVIISAKTVYVYEGSKCKYSLERYRRIRPKQNKSSKFGIINWN